MKVTNKKAIRNIAVFPMAKLTNTKFVESNVTEITNLEKFSIPKASRLSGITLDELTGFYLIRGYIRKEPYGYSATLLGIEKGCFVNDKDLNAIITTEGICKVTSAFAA